MSRLLTKLSALFMALFLAAGLMAVPAQAAKKDITLVVTELPAQVRLIPGESIMVSLSTNATTGYTWGTKVTGDKKAVKVYKGVYAAPAETGMVGVPGVTSWQITAKKVGTSVVTITTTAPGGGTSNVGKVTVIVMK
ncbi:MAG: protease inhibitor I42 family protein [Candidatus Nanopelagicales bacterium]|nr:protease inhibitor I42 family protein [Candidatus Nanopelagicales bacterium]MCF8539297.1 protease inhibitor I42 family protein [Candidatus Nanopelagicales bacterium]